MKLPVLLLAALLASSIPAAQALPPPTPPPPGIGGSPQNFTATYDAVNGTMHLSWSPPGNGTYTYTLHRNNHLLGSTAATQFIDLAPGQTNLYELRAMDSQGQSSSAYALTGFGSCSLFAWSIEGGFPYVRFRITADECLRATPRPGDIVHCTLLGGRVTCG